MSKITVEIPEKLLKQLRKLGHPRDVAVRFLRQWLPTRLKEPPDVISYWIERWQKKGEKF